jgi:hypothetical protein
MENELVVVVVILSLPSYQHFSLLFTYQQFLLNFFNYQVVVYITVSGPDNARIA